MYRPFFRVKSKQPACCVPMGKSKTPSAKELKKARKQMKAIKKAQEESKATPKNEPKKSKDPKPRSALKGKDSKGKDKAPKRVHFQDGPGKIQAPKAKKAKVQEAAEASEDEVMGTSEAESILKSLEVRGFW